MPTTQAAREAERASVRTNLREAVEAMRDERPDHASSYTFGHLAGLQIACLLNLAETIDAATDRSDEAEKLGKSKTSPIYSTEVKKP